MTVSQVEQWFIGKGYTGLSTAEKFDKWHTEGMNEVEPPPPPIPPMTANQVYAYIADNYPS